MATAYSIRQAGVSDSDRIALLHASSWIATYRGILPDAYLDNDLAAERKEYWKRKVEGLKENEFVLLAENELGLLGFCAVLDKPENGYDAFIDNLHVQPNLKGRGIGRKLMQAVAEKLLTTGRTSVYLWVLKGNTAAEHFYRSRYGKPADVSVADFGGKEVSQTRFVWNTLAELSKG